MLEFDVVKYRGLYAIDDLATYKMAWEDLVDMLSFHTPLRDKMTGAGWGPYAIEPPRNGPCYNHRGEQPHPGPHRCDSCVKEQTVLVFDADIGDAGAVARCQANLEQAGVAQHWHSTYSYRNTPYAPLALRLVVPLATPIPPEHARAIREEFIRGFSVPADPKKCSGNSHFYFLPSRPPDPTALLSPLVDPPYLYTRPGSPYQTRPLIPTTLGKYVRLPDNWKPAATEKKLDLRRVSTRLGKMAREKDPRAVWLLRLLAGEALDVHGHRDEATTRTCGILAWLYPDASIEALMAVLEPSVEKMIAAGSKLTHTAVERKLWSALRNKALDDARVREIELGLKAQLKAQLDAGRYRPPTPPTSSPTPTPAPTPATGS